MSSATTAPAPPVARSAFVLLVVCVAQFMLLADDTIVNVALPSIAADLGFTKSSLSWVVNAYLLTFGGFLLIGGRLADRFGPRRLFRGSLAGFALASALCGLAPSAEILVAARGLQGVTAALLSPAALAILLATYPEGNGRRRALSAWTALMGLGAAVGLVAGGALVEAADWRWVFLVNLPVAGAALMASGRILPAHDASASRPAPNVGGATLATLALLLLVFTVVETHDEGWTSSRTLVSFGVVALLAAAFAISERRAASPLLPLELIRRRRAMSANAVVFIAAGGLLAMFFFLTLYLQEVLGFEPLQTGLAFLPFSLAMGVASGVAMKLPETIDPRVPIVVGLVLASVGLWLMSNLGVDSDYAADVMPALVLVATGLGLALVPVMGLATGGAEERDGGLASGLMTSAQQIGGAIGIAVMVSLATARTQDAVGEGMQPGVALTEGFAAAFRVESGVMLFAAVLAVLVLGAGTRRVSTPASA